MPSCNTYRLTWVSVTLDMWYLFTAAQRSAAATSYLGLGVSPHGRPSWPWTWSSSSRHSCAHAAAAQHHNSKASGIWCSTIFMVPLPHPYIWKNHNFDYMGFVGKWYLSFLIHCLCLSWLSFQGANVFEFHGCSYIPQWLWKPRIENLSPLPLFPLLFVMKWWTRCHGLSFLNAEF